VFVPYLVLTLLIVIFSAGVPVVDATVSLISFLVGVACPACSIS